MPTKGAIHIREVNKALIQQLKVEAAKRGLTLRDYVLQVLEIAVTEAKADTVQ
jgi:hypothetical protein